MTELLAGPAKLLLTEAREAKRTSHFAGQLMCRAAVVLLRDRLGRELSGYVQERGRALEISLIWQLMERDARAELEWINACIEGSLLANRKEFLPLPLVQQL
ncbi:unnamed protein product [Protopolystoma xenopodis]|uniref:Uncharacterized protein n=1 Tax=Protopolystoma xenopodis TaxID=117903 RepID=A0A3S5A619_9PLAT|nr:unnamed protein product [Protopolystoma xenopodis]